MFSLLGLFALLPPVCHPAVMPAPSPLEASLPNPEKGIALTSPERKASR